MTCKAEGCITRRGIGKSLFCIPDPSRKPDLCNKWLTSLGISTSGYVHNKNNFVCEDHFELCCFENCLMARLVGNTIKRKQRLKPDSVPTIFPNSEAKLSRKRALCQDNSVKVKQEESEVQMDTVLTYITENTTLTKKRRNAMEPEDRNVKKSRPIMVDIGVQVGPKMKSAASDCNIQTDVTASLCTNCSIACNPKLALTDHRYCLNTRHFNR